MSALNNRFLHLLDMMLSPLLTGDGFKWVITSINLFEAGPCATFHYDWRPTTSHDSFACMTLRAYNGVFTLQHETCTMGKATTDATHALMNRFQRAQRALRA